MGREKSGFYFHFKTLNFLAQRPFSSFVTRRHQCFSVALLMRSSHLFKFINSCRLAAPEWEENWESHQGLQTDFWVLWDGKYFPVPVWKKKKRSPSSAKVRSRHCHHLKWWSSTFLTLQPFNIAAYIVTTIIKLFMLLLHNSNCKSLCFPMVSRLCLTWLLEEGIPSMRLWEYSQADWGRGAGRDGWGEERPSAPGRPLNHVNKGAQMGSRWFASISNIHNATCHPLLWEEKRN